MWYLTSENDDRFLYVLSGNKDITVGRSVDPQICNFAITDDPSISRKHATLLVSDNALYIQDLGSRYGTFINDFSDKLNSSTKVKVCANDIVKFGKMDSIWKVHEVSLVTCTSTLKGENLQNLKQVLAQIGGVLKNVWDDTCTYLTMPAITLTIKVVLALVQGSYIVTTDYWSKCLEAVLSNAELPSPKNYIPQVVESTLNKENISFLPNSDRKILFAGKKIVFFSKRQLEMYKTALVGSSATALLLSESMISKSMLCNSDVIVIQYNITNTSQETQAQRAQINDIVAYLKNNGKRVVADAEIGLAILYCSTEKYCNPDFNFSSEVLKQTAQNPKSTNILAKESQEITNKATKDNIVIDETLLSNDQTNNVCKSDKLETSKRKFIEDDEISSSICKKVATNVISPSIETGKRKYAEESNEASLNPSKKLAIDDNDQDDFFNFKNSSEANNSNTEIVKERKLNLSKPIKRKADIAGNDEEELFNFVQDKSTNSSGQLSNQNVFKVKKTDSVNDENTEMSDTTKPPSINEKDVAAMRGTKLKELMESNISIPNSVKIKKEDTDELGSKMKELDLGSTIIIVDKDLIVKKEPLEIETTNKQIINFKKFKKVWPVKMQVSVLSSSSMNVM